MSACEYDGPCDGVVVIEVWDSTWQPMCADHFWTRLEGPPPTRNLMVRSPLWLTTT